MQKTSQVASSSASEANTQFPQSTGVAADYFLNPLNQMCQATAVPTTSAQSESTSATPPSSSPRKRHLPTSSSTPQKKKLETGGSSTAPSNNVSTPSSASMQHPLSEPPGLTTDKMFEYLQNKNSLDCTVTIHCPKVALKSYQAQHGLWRPIYPPPIIQLKGLGWDVKRAQAVLWYNNQEQGTTASGMEGTPKQGHLTDEEAGELCVFIGIGAQVEHERRKLDFDGKDYFALLGKEYWGAGLYFDLSLQLLYGGRLEVGMFRSQRIKAVVQVPKNEKSLKKSDLMSMRIQSGTEVALYYRATKKENIRYLHVENNGFHPSYKQWGAFTIHLYDDELPDGEEEENFYAREGIVYYGSVVKIEDSTNHISLPELRIRKVDGQYAKLDEATNEEPVCQMQKCAFQYVENEFFYLCLGSGGVTMSMATRIGNDHEIRDDAVWTIVNTAKSEYTFYEAMGPGRAVTPVPVAVSMELSGSFQKTRLTIFGSNFNLNLTIWLGATPVATVCRSEESLTCLLPSWATVAKDYNGSRRIDPMKVPISLVREDGVIYPTSLSHDYGSLQKPPRIDD